MYISVQYLRAFAAILVVLTHSRFKIETFGGTLLNNFRIGEYGVDLFFIISGFIMCLTVSRKKISFLSFMKARCLRILPLYWTLTTVALFIFLLTPNLVNSSGGSTSIINSYFLIPNESKFLINNGWTLSYEFYFYIIFSVFLFTKDKHLTITSITLILITTIPILINNSSHIFSFLTSPLLLEFLMGILAYKIVNNFPDRKLLSYALILVGIISLIDINNNGPINTFWGRALYAGLPMLSIFIGFVSLEIKIKKIPIIYNLGMCSYSLYLIHPFTIKFTTIIFSKANIINNSLAYLIAMITLSFIGSFICYYYIETKLNKLLKIYFINNSNTTH